MGYYDTALSPMDDLREADCIMAHAAITAVHKTARIIAPGQGNHKDRELIQLAVEWPNFQMPIHARDVQKAFGEMCVQCIERMRKCGLIRE